MIRRLSEQDRERGSASALFVTLVPAFILVVGLVTDGGAQLAAINHATAASEQAARLAAQEITGSVLTGQRPVVAAGSASQTAHQALAAQGVTGSVSVSGDTVTVTASATRDTVFLSILGIDTVTGTGEATARLARGTSTEVP